MLTENIIFDYATQWVQNHPTIPPVTEFNFSDDEYEQFKEFVKESDFEYDRISEKTLRSLEEVMEFEGYMKTAEDEFKALEDKLVPDLDRDFETFKDEIKSLLSSEIVKRYYYKKGAVQESLKTDKTFDKAVDVLKDKQLYDQTLKPTPKNMPSAKEIKEKIKDQYSDSES